MRDKIAKLASQYVQDSIQDWIRDDCPSGDDRVMGEYTGAEGPKAPGVPQNKAEAKQRAKSLVTHQSLFEVAGTGHSPIFERHPDPNTRAFTGPDGRPRERIFKNEKHEFAAMPDSLDPKYLKVLVNTYLPTAVTAYKEIRGEDPELRPLGIEWDDGKVPEGSIARHHCVDGKSLITVKCDAFRDLNYLEWVVKHELIHYLLNTPDEQEDHGLEFQLMSNFLEIPAKYRA